MALEQSPAKGSKSATTVAIESRLGKPIKFLGLEFAPVALPLERRLQTLAVILHMTLFMLGGLLFLILSYNLVFYSENWKWLPLLYFAWYFYDLDTAEQGGRNFTYGQGKS